MIAKTLSAFSFEDSHFNFISTKGPWSYCQVNVYTRPDLGISAHWAVVLFTQAPDEVPSIYENIEILAGMAMEKFFYRRGITAIHPSRIIFLVDFPATQEVRYGRTERVFFRVWGGRPGEGNCYLADPISHRTRPGVVEALMGRRTWAQMGMPDIKWYVG